MSRTIVEVEAGELVRMRYLLSQLTDHLEDMGFPHGKAQHKLECECKDCEAWADLQSARMLINHPKAVQSPQGLRKRRTMW